MGWRFTLGGCPASSEPSEPLFQLHPPCSRRPECDHTVPSPGPSVYGNCMHRQEEGDMDSVRCLNLKQSLSGQGGQ